MQTRSRTTAFPWKRAVGIVLAQAGIVLLLLFAGELFVRCWREKGVRSGLASLFDARGTQVDPATQGAFAPDAELGYRLRPEVEGVNELGFRGPEMGPPKPSGCFRVLVMGDSQGWDVDGFPSVLASRVEAPASGDSRPARHIEVLNASVPGYTTFQERIFLARLLAPVQSDLVVLEYCLNDNHRFLHRLTEDGGWLLTPEARAALLPEGDGVLARIARWSYLAFEVKKRLLARQRRIGTIRPWESEPDFGPAWDPGTWPLVREQILAIQSATRASEARLLVLAIPYPPQLEPALLAREREIALAPQARLASICAEAGIPFLDLAPAFEAGSTASPREPLYRDGVHLTPAGHAMVGNALFERLCAERLLPEAEVR